MTVWSALYFQRQVIFTSASSLSPSKSSAPRFRTTLAETNCYDICLIQKVSMSSWERRVACNRIFPMSVQQTGGWWKQRVWTLLWGFKMHWVIPQVTLEFFSKHCRNTNSLGLHSVTNLHKPWMNFPIGSVRWRFDPLHPVHRPEVQKSTQSNNCYLSMPPKGICPTDLRPVPLRWYMQWLKLPAPLPSTKRWCSSQTGLWSSYEIQCQLLSQLTINVLSGTVDHAHQTWYFSSQLLFCNVRPLNPRSHLS